MVAYVANQGASALIAQDEARSRRVAELMSARDLGGNLGEWITVGSTTAGIAVTAENAERVSAVFACIGVISKTVATLPLHIYRRKKDGGKERAVDHPLYQILHDAPNETMTSAEAREMMQAYATGSGNAYGLVYRNGAGRVSSIVPHKPSDVTVYKRDGKLFYQVLTDHGLVTVGSENMLHIRGRSKDGIMGMSPIAYAREAIGLAIATEKHGASYFGNGARPSGVITSPTALGPDKVRALQDAWEEKHRGPSNMQRPAVLFGGTTWQPFAVSNDDAQFLETRKFQVSDIARIFGVPPHKIGDMTQATFSNIEHQAIEFVTDCIRPWLVRWEQRMNTVLLTEAERQEYFIEFSIEGLLRGDLKSRYEAYNIGRNGGWLSANDVRDLENMNRIEGGDSYMQPLNMGKLGEFQEQQNANTGGQTP